MASAQSHPPFTSSRPYSKLPERPSAFAASSAARETALQRQDRERLERERAGPPPATGSSPLNALSDEQKEEINEAFGLFDLDKDQRIDYHEFKVALKALGFDLPKSEILAFLTAHGIPPADKIQNQPQSSRVHQNQNQQPPVAPGRLLLTLPSFQTIAAQLIGNRDPRDEILRAFALFDTEDKGIISLEDLRRVARELGEGLEEEELVAMIEEFDLEGKGGVGRDEFVQICMG
ncbi:Nucleoporin CDC31 [Hyphodiscus hymeniophilus]|uniref:Nucleoporin CDC31 n=1 Tax=Hyphodiscus hymeniophilus TaxID=353542 RepID=A0A9P6VJ93_9HELO|nr:Nucleoporin CDC31 [Hyphodiscus hymeniophilus]